MLDPSQLGGSAGGPPPMISLPGAGGPGPGPGGPPPGPAPSHAPSGGDPDEAAEQKAKRALQQWMGEASDPQEHAFAAKLYQQVVQYLAKEHDEVHNALGMSSMQKTIARANGR